MLVGGILYFCGRTPSPYRNLTGSFPTANVDGGATLLSDKLEVVSVKSMKARSCGQLTNEYISPLAVSGENRKTAACCHGNFMSLATGIRGELMATIGKKGLNIHFNYIMALDYYCKTHSLVAGIDSLRTANPNHQRPLHYQCQTSTPHAIRPLTDASHRLYRAIRCTKQH